MSALLSIALDGFCKPQDMGTFGLFFSFKHAPAGASCDLLLFLHVLVTTVTITKDCACATWKDEGEMTEGLRKICMEQRVCLWIFWR